MPVTMRLTLFVLLLPSVLKAQSRQTISGTLKDAGTGEVLIGASIRIPALKGAGTVTNAYGFYALTVPVGTYTLVVSYTGYETFTREVLLDKALKLDITLAPGATGLQEVVVAAQKKDEQISKPLMGVDKINIKDIRHIPVLLGERDILKTIQLMPGIKSAGEGNSGFYVRGGGADQNLILLDEAPVYNASHLLGFFSAFNADAIKDVSVYKGGMPAQYGGRLSSVLDIKMNDGNAKDYGVSGGIGLIASRVNIEGPIVKDKGSFIISARRTYADLFLKLSSDSTVNGNSLYFYDINAKANYSIGKNDRVFLSGYFGRDLLGFGKTLTSDWGNRTATLRWNHIFNSRLFSNTSLIYSKFKYELSIQTSTDNFDIDSKIEDLNFKQDFDLFLNNANKLKFGFNIIHHTTSPGRITATSTSNLRSSEVQDRYSLENAAYITNEWEAGKLTINYGLRLSSFMTLGEGDFYTYDKEGALVDTMHAASGEVVKTYWNLEPRVSGSYRLNEVSSVKASYARNVQNLHLLSNTTSILPNDLWISSSNNVQPEIADQVSVGYYRNFKDNNYEFSAELYYKWLQHQIDYKNGAELRANDNVESELVFVKGRAYGLELFLKKRYGRLNGWVSYTISRAERRFDEINNGSYYPAKQDRTHDIAVVGIYKLSKRWTLSGTFVYNTGNAVTFPSGKYHANGQTVFYYTERNGYRMPSYHRLDIAATLDGRKKKRLESSWTFGLYNAYGRENAYTIEFRDSETDPGKTEALQTALFKFVPAVTWNFKF